MNNKKSFTLIELLVVIVIIGILAGVIMISTSSSIDKANIAKLKVFEESIQNNLAANMVSRWPLDEGSGNIVNDVWNTKQGTLYNFNNTPTSGWLSESQCVSGSCLIFDGSDDYIIFQGIDLSNLSKSSISFWRKQTSLKDWLLLRGQSSAEYVMATAGGTGSFYHSNTGGLKKIYIDGVLSIKPATDYNWHFYLITDVDLTLWTSLNLTHYGGVWEYDGYLDDLRIYDEKLSLSQMKQKYIAGLNSMLANGNISKEEYNERINTLAYEQE